jgi:hypothetical protein
VAAEADAEARPVVRRSWMTKLAHRCGDASAGRVEPGVG